MTEKEFRTLVKNKITAGLSFVKAVYEAMGEVAVAEEQQQWACQRGCSFCCNQMVQVTSGEIEEIIRYLKTLPRQNRRIIMKQAWKMVAKYLKWFTSLGGSINPILHDPLWVNEQWQGRPCPFLSDSGTCRIYPVRPIDCRTLHSTTICQNWTWSDAKRMPDEYEQWANNMILEHERKVRGVMAVAPIHHWLKAKEKALKS